MLRQPRPDIETVIEPLAPEDLRPAFERLVSRTRPASPEGEGIRDILLWLAVKRTASRLNEERGPIIFISGDKKAFADNESGRLHPTLVQELDEEGLQVQYCASLKNFAERFGTRITTITEDWVAERFSNEEAAQLAEDYFRAHENALVSHLQRTEFPTAASVIIYRADLELDLVHVFELQGGQLDGIAHYSGELFVEMTLTGGPKGPNGLATIVMHAHNPGTTAQCPRARLRIPIHDGRRLRRAFLDLRRPEPEFYVFGYGLSGRRAEPGDSWRI